MLPRGRGDDADSDRGSYGVPDLSEFEVRKILESITADELILIEALREIDPISRIGVYSSAITELNLAYSRDGFHWYRPDRRPFIWAERRDVWDRGYVQPVGGICTIHGDTLWFYYTGFQGNVERKKLSFLRNGMYDRGSTGVAFMRRDGFVSMDAGEQPAELLTRPVRFSGRCLFVNADLAQGEVLAEIVDESGEPISPYTLENCRLLSTDSTIQQITWRSDNDLASVKNKSVRFRFRMKNGSLFAFWVSRDESGCSDGYVAAGGPGYTGPIDTVGKKALGME